MLDQTVRLCKFGQNGPNEPSKAQKEFSRSYLHNLTWQKFQLWFIQYLLLPPICCELHQHGFAACWVSRASVQARVELQPSLRCWSHQSEIFRAGEMERWRDGEMRRVACCWLLWPQHSHGQPSLGTACWRIGGLLYVLKWWRKSVKQG